MIKELKFESIIETIIGDINEAKRRSSNIHRAGNIKASGDEVEDLIREKISLFLPERYLVKQGHIVNSAGKVSNQLDIIIFDRLSTPKFFEAQNNSVFYPIESVLAIGEIKKTLRADDIVEFAKKIKFIKEDMNRELISNTIYDGELNDDTSFLDMINMGMDRKNRNSLFSFIFAIDVVDINNLMIVNGGKYMPNDVYILNDSMYFTGTIKNGEIIYQLEDECGELEEFIHIRKSGVVCLSTLFNNLIDHLNKSYIEPFGISTYMTNGSVFSILGKETTVYRIKN